MSRDFGACNLAAIGVGSNLDDPAKQVRRALGALADLPDSRLVNASSLYLSAPFGGVEQPDFVNAAATLRTSLTARQLLDELKGIERRLGRTAGERWGPRIIDLDLLVLGDAEVNEPGLQVPHPGIAGRNFVLLPLREIVPELVIPGLGRLSELAVDESDPPISRLKE